MKYLFLSILFFCNFCFGSFFVPSGSVVTSQLADSAVTSVKRAAVVSGVSLSSNSFTTSSTTYVDVTNLSVTLSLSGTKPVFVGMVSDPTGSSSGWIGATAASGVPLVTDFAITVDAANVYQTNITNDANQAPTSTTFMPCSSVWTIVPTVSAGSHTFKVRQKVQGTPTGQTSFCNLVVYEM